MIQRNNLYFLRKYLCLFFKIIKLYLSPQFLLFLFFVIHIALRMKKIFNISSTVSVQCINLFRAPKISFKSRFCKIYLIENKFINEVEKGMFINNIIGKFSFSLICQFKCQYLYKIQESLHQKNAFKEHTKNKELKQTF